MALNPKKLGVEEASACRRLTLVFTSENAKDLDAVCTELIENARSKDLEVSGPIRMPTRRLRITCRKTPCGQGSKTWDKFQMNIYKRLVYIRETSEVLSQLTTFTKGRAGVEIAVKMKVRDEAAH